MNSSTQKLEQPLAAFLPLNLLKVAGGSLLLAASSYISIPLPFTPVPVSLQPHMVLLLAVLMGPWRSMSAVLLFLAEGAAGLPVFANGAAGLIYLLGPTGGYLVSYIGVSFMVGTFCERSGFAGRLLAVFGGSAVILFTGWAWLALFVGASQAVTIGVVPFLWADILKSIGVIAAAQMIQGAKH